MNQPLMIIADTLRAPETTGKLMLALGFETATPSAKNEAKRYAASVLAELEKMANDEKKKDILLCHPQSIVQTMIDAAKFRLMIDGRQHAHLVKYGNVATLQIGYRGYIAKIAEHYDDADLNVFPVFEGDDLTISGGDGFDRYDHKRANAFNDDEEKFKGVCAVLYYKKGGREFQKIITMSKKEIMKVKNAAKLKTVWDAWFIEKAKVAAVKRICKLQFSSISILQEMVEFDNRKHYDIEKPVEETKPGSIIDNLNKGLDPTPPAADTPKPTDDVIDVDHKTIDQDVDVSPDIKKSIAAVRRAINMEETVEGMDALFDIDYKADIEKIKAASGYDHDQLLMQRAARLEQIKSGGA